MARAKARPDAGFLLRAPAPEPRYTLLCAICGEDFGPRVRDTIGQVEREHLKQLHDVTFSGMARGGRAVFVLVDRWNGRRRAVMN